MRSLVLIFLIVLLPAGLANAQTVPEGYILQYGQNFNNNNNALTDFWFSNASLWNVSRLQTNDFLQCDAGSGTDSLALSPVSNRAVLKDRIFGDFILEAEIMPLESPSVPWELSIMLDIKDSTKYYYILLAGDSAADPGIYLVSNSVPHKLPLRVSVPVTLRTDSWQKIRVERNIVRRTIRVFAGSMEKPVMEAKDYELIMGYIGFGTLRGTARFDNISVWAPTVIVPE